MTTTIELLRAHRSVRKYSDQTVDQSSVEKWIQAGQAAATSSFIQACTVIQVSQGARRDSLAELAGNQLFIKDAPVFLVFCADMNRHKTACDMHDAKMQSGFTEQFITATVDCSLFAQNVVTAAESEGMGICYIGGIRNNIEAVSDLLTLPELMFPLFGLCIGVPAQNPEVKPRLPVASVLKQERYTGDDDQALLTQYDDDIAEYYQSRSSNTKVASWTSQISAMLQKEARPHMLAYLKKQGFLLK